MKIKLNFNIENITRSEIIEITDSEVEQAIKMYQSTYKNEEEAIQTYASMQYLDEFVFDSIDAWVEIVEK